MDLSIFMYCQILIVLAIQLVVHVDAQSLCPVRINCGFRSICAMVRQGRGPPVPECVSRRDAAMLEGALLGAATGPGTGRRGRRFHRRRGHYPRRRQYPQYPGIRGPYPGGVGGPLGGVGIPLGPVGVGRGVADLGHIHGQPQNTVSDQSRAIKIHLNINNNNENIHDQRGSGNVQVTQGRTGGTTGCETPCDRGVCPPGLHCLYTEGCSSSTGENFACRSISLK